MCTRTPGHGEQIDVARVHVANAKTLGDRAIRKACTVLNATETLFFDRRDELTVADEHRGDVAVVGVQSKNVHEAL